MKSLQLFLLLEFFYGEGIENGRVMSSAIGDIDLNEAMSAEHLNLGVTRYTFRLETNEPNVFKNLIIRRDQEDRFNGYTIAYYPNLEWLLQNEGKLEMISFTGNMLFSSLRDKPIYWVLVNNGKGTVYSPKTGSDEGVRVDCGGSGSYSGGSGPDDAGFGDSWVPTGGGGFDYAPDLPSGGSGGGVIFIIEIYEEEEPPEDWLARTACDSGSPESFCPSDTSPDAVEEDANCPSNPIGVLDSDLSDYLADAWEEEICLKKNFSNNACVNEIWNIMKDNNVGYETLTNFLGDNPKAALCLNIKDLGSSIKGNTDPTIPREITINLNSQKLNRSKLGIARTLLHEMIHAELFSYVIEAGGYDNFRNYALNYNDEFLALWNYIDEYHQNGPWQHEYIADNYITYIANGLRQLERFFISQSFKNAANSGYYLDVLGEEWNWDDFYEYMAWEELHKTGQFQTEIADSGRQNKYIQYRRRFEEDNSVNLDCSN